MQYEIINIKGILENTQISDILKLSMFRPTPEKLKTRIDKYQANSKILAFGVKANEEFWGIVVFEEKQDLIEILDIATAPDKRSQGAATRLIANIKEQYPNHDIFAETDDDAIIFYKKLGFSCKEIESEFDTIRYGCILKNDSQMIHFMKLQPEPFEKIKSGEKTIELRLNDEKRQRIKLGDMIVFSCGENKLNAKVIALYRFSSFNELYATLPLRKCGYGEFEINTASPDDMLKYYSKEAQEKCGVLGIEISVTD